MFWKYMMLTGLLWWCWAILKSLEWVGKAHAKRKGEVWTDLMGRTYDFRHRYNKGAAKTHRIDLRDNAEEKTCKKCKPKPKWERLNVENDSSGNS
jgi:hypothetical protein